MLIEYGVLRVAKMCKVIWSGQGPRSRAIKPPDKVIYPRTFEVGADTDCFSIIMKLYPRFIATKVLRLIRKYPTSFIP